MLELMLQKWPMNRDAPVMQNKIAELYDQLSQLAPDGSAAKAEYGSKALEARTKLAAYVGTTPWVEATRTTPRRSRRPSGSCAAGLKRAAADHTNLARSYYEQALELSNEGEQRALIEKSIAEYQLAETGWAGYLAQDRRRSTPTRAASGSPTRATGSVVLTGGARALAGARRGRARAPRAVAVRDSNEDDKYLQPSAYYVVTSPTRCSRTSTGSSRRRTAPRASRSARR